ncbi:MAG: hypothetical protein M1528_00380 [Candidatus Marsarchaeota archaeon]|jgi:hypothetical protein|nr:hypothetical protein [Candidatus Marsarchaeota archaeon]MCL5114985.1 hypothetical protein [Candidatus Marsarchaeota archaeon]
MAKLCFSASRSQSAVEYLMTYGWMLLIVAIVLFVLYASGILNTNIFVSASCLLPSQFSCSSPILATNGLLTLNIVQNTGNPISITAIYCNASENIPFNAPAIAKTYLGIGGNATFKVPCYIKPNTVFTGSLGEVYRGYVILNYTDIPSSLSFTVSGTLVAKVDTT